MKDLSTLSIPDTSLDFILPPALEADSPPEARTTTLCIPTFANSQICSRRVTLW